MIKLPYGHGEVTLRLPPGTAWDTILYPGAHLKPADASAVLERALAAPIDTPPLHELARNRSSAAILISDSTRLSPSFLFLPLLLRELARGGMSEDRITIVVALGMHRKQTEEELIRLVGSGVYRRVRVVNHSALAEDCEPVGTTSRGTPVAINRIVAQAELRIATGNIEPHAMVGASGGVKALVPGVAARDTIERHHALSQTWKARPGFPDNPLHRDLEEAQRLLPLHFLFNVIVNHRQEPLAAFAGRVEAAHRAGVEEAKRMFLVEAEPKYDVVIVSPGGYPKDTQLYQAVKTLKNAAAHAVPGGAIVIASRCQELFGNGTLQYWIETIQDREVMARKLRERFVLGAHKAEHIDQLLKRHRIYLYSDMPRASVELTGFTPVEDLDAALAGLLEGRPAARVAVLPHGGLTYPLQS
jgi:nickel-dependent lactate racemase